MPCSCSKKGGAAPLMGKDSSEPEIWGPILWKYLHCIAENIGYSGNIMDTDQANYVYTIITSLHLIIPCQDCQSHTLSYITSNPFPILKDLHGVTLRSTVSKWLFQFHNSVRNMKGQPIMLHTPEECAQYTGNGISKSDYAIFVQSVTFAVRKGWVRIDNWRKWYSNSERLRIIVGNIII